MKVISSELGVQSWSFRGLGGNEANIAALKTLGLSALEMSGIFVNLDNVEQVVKLYHDHGILLTALGVAHIPNDEAVARREFELAKRLGVKLLSIDPDEGSIPLIEQLCEEYGIKTAIHNHGRTHRYGSLEQLHAILDGASSNVGLFLDVAWAMDSGADPRDYIAAFGDRLYGLHLKDFVLRANEPAQEVVVGTGDLQLRAVLDILKERGYQGVISIEYEEKESDPVADIGECIRNIVAADCSF